MSFILAGIAVIRGLIVIKQDGYWCPAIGTIGVVESVGPGVRGRR